MIKKTRTKSMMPLIWLLSKWNKNMKVSLNKNIRDFIMSRKELSLLLRNSRGLNLQLCLDQWWVGMRSINMEQTYTPSWLLITIFRKPLAFKIRPPEKWDNLRISQLLWEITVLLEVEYLWLKMSLEALLKVSLNLVWLLKEMLGTHMQLSLITGGRHLTRTLSISSWKTPICSGRK
jgi:hypothetical protein